MAINLVLRIKMGVDVEVRGRPCAGVKVCGCGGEREGCAGVKVCGCAGVGVLG